MTIAELKELIGEPELAPLEDLEETLVASDVDWQTYETLFSR